MIEGKWKGLFYMIMNENVGTSCIIVCSCIREYPLFTMVRSRMLRCRKTIIMSYHNAAMVTILTKCSTITPKNARPNGKGAKEVYEPTGGPILTRVGRV